MDTTSTCNYVSTLFQFFLLVSFHIFSYYTTPSTVSREKDFFEIEPSFNKNNIVLNLSYVYVQGHRFIYTKCVLAKADIYKTIESLKFLFSISSTNNENKKEIIKFSKEFNFFDKTTPFTIFYTNEKDIQSINLDIKINGPLKKISEIEFFSYHVNLDSETHYSSCRILVLIVTLYSFFSFLISYNFKIKSQPFLFALGVCGVLSLIPWNDISKIHALNELANSAFLTGFRLLVLSELISLFKKKYFSKSIKIIIYTFFFLYGLALFDSSHKRSSYMRTTDFETPFLVSEFFLFLFDTFYSIVILTVFIREIPEFCKEQEVRLLVFLGIEVVFTFYATMYSGVFCLFSGEYIYSETQIFLRNYIYLACLAFSLHMYRKGKENMYIQIGS